MLNKKIFLSVSCLLCLVSFSLAQAALPQLFLFLGGDNSLINDTTNRRLLQNRCVNGVQLIYTWKELEPKKDQYDFSNIEKDLKTLNALHKKLFIQLQDRSFQPDKIYVPDYIKDDPIYHGGVAKQFDFPGEGLPITEGWVARVWDRAVQDRFQLLLKKLAEKFDGKIYGINLPETAVDFDLKNLPQGFSNDNYFYAELENLGMLKKYFQKSIVIQYVNFFPGEWNNDHHYMEKLFLYAQQNKIGLGGPDSVPYNPSQMENSYPFFYKSIGVVAPVSMAIQEPDYTYRDPKTHNYYQFSDFYSFTKNYLGATILFWNIEEPFLSDQLIPVLNEQNFSCKH